MTMVSGGLEAALSLVAERAEAAGAARRLDDDVVGALAAAGLNRSFVPTEMGGVSAPPRAVFDAITRVAAVDGSTAWCASISAGSNVFAGYVPEETARSTWTDPDAGAAGMFAPAGVVTVGADGRATLTGRWPFTSNCLHSRLIGLGAWIEDAEGIRSPQPRLMVLPAEDVAIEDTWDAGGLRATGSHHVRVDGAVVDLSRSCTFADRPWPDGPLWRLPLFTVLGPVLVAVPLGIARGAVDDLLERVRGGGGGAMRGPLADDPVGMAALGEAHSALSAARAGVTSLLEEAWDVALGGERASRALQARTALAVLHACDTAVAATSTVHRLSGGSAAFTGHRALKALRDVETARQHVMFSHQHRPALTRVAAGVDEVVPPFVT